MNLPGLPFDIVFLNAAPPAVLSAVLLAGAVYLFLAYHRFSVAARPAVRAALLILRALLMLVVFFILMDPYWSREKENEWVGVLVDTSSSMSVRDEAGGRSRLEAVQRFLKEDSAWKNLGKGALRRFYTFDGKLRDGTSEDLLRASPGGTESRLVFAARELNRIYGEDPGLLGWVVFSDGAATDDPAGASAVFGDPAFPWIAVKAGSAVNVANISIQAPGIDEFVFTHQKIPVEARWASSLPEDAVVRLQVRLDGSELFEKEVSAADEKHRFEISVPSAGPHVLDFDIRAPEGESVLAESDHSDNQIRAWFQAGSRKLKVFYAESFFKDENFFKKALEEDRVFQVDFASSLIGFAKKQNVPFIKDPVYGLPRTREGLQAYDVIVLSDVKRNLLTPDQILWIRELVEKEGGALVMVGGVDSFGDGGYSGSELEKLLPVEISDVYKKDVYLAAKGTVDQPFRPVLSSGEEKHPLLQLTEDPDKNKTLWNTMPNLGGYNYVGRLKPGAASLLQHPADVSSHGPRVILAVQNFGEGKSLAFTSDVTPNWGQWFQDWKTEEEGWLYSSFWRNAFLWLTENRSRRKLEPFDVVMTPSAPEENQSVEWTAYLPGSLEKSPLDSSLQFEVFQETRRVRFLEPSVVSAERKFTWSAGSFAPGDYRLRVTWLRKNQPSLSVEKTFSVRPSLVEARHLTAAPEMLDKLARETQGEAFTLAEPRLEEALRKIRKVHLRRHSAPAWHHPLVYLLVMGLLSLDWFLRKKKGLE